MNGVIGERLTKYKISGPYVRVRVLVHAMRVRRARVLQQIAEMLQL